MGRWYKLKNHQYARILIILSVMTFLIFTGCDATVADNNSGAAEVKTAVSGNTDAGTAVANTSASTYTAEADSTARNTEENPAVNPAASSSSAGTSKTGINSTDSGAKKLLKAHFIDVGQADSILVELPDNEKLLVDAGNNNDSDTIHKYLDSLGVKRLDFVVGTHPHEDHIGSLDDIIYDYDIGTIYMPKASATTKCYKDVVKALDAEHLKPVSPEAGSYMLERNITGETGDKGHELDIMFLSPSKKKYDGINDYSIVMKITYGDTSLLLMADAGSENEMDILDAGYDVSADLLKVGHHGSAYSTSATFLKAVKPEFAIIEVGAGNDYGNPAKSTLRRLQNFGMKILRTDEMGTITAVSDGDKITVQSDK